MDYFRFDVQQMNQQIENTYLFLSSSKNDLKIRQINFRPELKII